ncbi:MAG: M24 family metallopeptidase, partial [Pseudomonadota bacterium]
HAFPHQCCVPIRQERGFVHVPSDRMAQPVPEGMIFTIEPSIFLDGDVSARVEDCIVARPGGGEALTGGFQELIVIA